MAGRTLLLLLLLLVLMLTLVLLRARALGSGRVDAFTVGEPWRSLVQDAVQAQRRFHDTVRRMRGGPLQDRLADVRARVDDGVRTAWEIATRGHELDDALRRLDSATVARRLARLGHDDPAREALEAQAAAAERIAARSQEARDRLRVLTARLDEAVARAVELSVQAHDLAAVEPVAGDVDAVVEELEALRAAVAETG